jgi:hypothetical protein
VNFNSLKKIIKQKVVPFHQNMNISKSGTLSKKILNR